MTQVNYREARSALKAATILDTVRDMLTEQPWAAISVSDIAKRCQLSRQTIYNEFGSRAGLMNAYILRLASTIITDATDQEHAGSGVYETFLAGFEKFFGTILGDPLIQTLLGESSSRELVLKLSEHGLDFVALASHNLAKVYRQRWPWLDDKADTLAVGVVRIALSYLATPSADPAQAADTLALLFTPYVEAARASET